MIYRSLFASSFVLASSFALASVACSSSTASTPTDAGTQPADGSSTPLIDASAPSSSDANAPPSGDDDAAVEPSSDASTGDDAPDLVMQAADFECILRWAKVGDYRITNKLVDAGASIAVGEADGGGVYPVGTLIQLIPNEAMVKRRAGFSPATHDWEFFNLSTSSSGTVINQRGGAAVTNAIGSCATCHGKAESQFDSVCGTTHGCDPLPFTESQILAIQNGDPRCP